MLRRNKKKRMDDTETFYYKKASIEDQLIQARNTKVAKHPRIQPQLKWLRDRELGNNACLEHMIKRTYQTCNVVASYDMYSGADSAIFNLEFSPEGRMLIAATANKQLGFFDPLTHKNFYIKRNAHADCINCVRFLNDYLFATGSDDDCVNLWDVRYLQKGYVKNMLGHTNWVKSIEYLEREKLLVTAGFDGDVITWDLTSPTPTGYEFRKVFHCDGLMRVNLTPDGNKMILCTTDGYMMIVYDLDFSTLETDLYGLRPSTYMMMQRSMVKIPVDSKYFDLVSSDREKNRIEFISDFPIKDDAEIISSLQVHPNGSCIVSRNSTRYEKSEFTCVHDIIDFKPNRYDDEDDSSLRRILFPSAKQGADDARGGTMPHKHDHGSYCIPGRSTGVQENSVGPFSSLSNEIWEVNIPLETYQQGRGVNPNEWLRSITLRRYYVTPDEPVQLSHLRTLDKNKPRLTYYIQESNSGKGFIKEICFSPDGRVICSPFAYGIRLLGFGENCEAVYTTVPKKIPMQLSEIASKIGHNDVVFCCKFSPTHYNLVSGCQSGQLVWYHPELF